MVVGFAHTDTGEKYGPHVERLKREYHRRPGWNLIICGSYTPVLFGDMWDERKR